MKHKITTFLMFDGCAEAAMNYYISIFEDTALNSITYYQEGEVGKEGTVKDAIFTIKGQQFMCIDTAYKHEFDFTPSISLFVDCENEAEIDELYEKISAEGKVFMVLGDYEFSDKYAWIQDKFGVSWQLILNKYE